MENKPGQATMIAVKLGSGANPVVVQVHLTILKSEARHRNYCNNKKMHV